MKTKPASISGLLARYNCGSVKFSGNENALYERHLTFDQVIPLAERVAARPI